MKGITYGTKLRLKKITVWTTAILAIILCLYIGRIIYVQRFLVYGETGVHLDYSGQFSESAKPNVTIRPGDFTLTEEAADGNIYSPSGGLSMNLHGLYFSVEQLTDETLVQSIPTLLENHNAVMLDMKTATGRYMYTTALSGTEQASVDLTALITELSKKPNLTLIAKVPAFRDSAHALVDFSQSIPIAGGALWMDQGGSYWLDPAGENVPNYLISIARELYSMGFDEIVFEDFHFPQSANIRYNRSITGEEAALQAAITISEQMKLYEIPVSFTSSDAEIISLSARAYIPAETGDQVSQLANEYSALLSGSDAQLVFLTNSRDTRFDVYSMLSPYVAEPQ